MSSNSRNDSKPPFNPLEGCNWPDPDPDVCHNTLKLDDVSRMSEVEVEGIMFPQTDTDVLTILQRARLENRRICARGTQHSMGGHSLVKQGYVVDTKYMNEIYYDPEKELVTCGAGCTWATVLQCLNRYNKSVSVLQSYCNFSVGGTMSVNAHGITSDDSLQASVVDFKLARFDSDTQEPEIVVCTRPLTPESDAELPPPQELYKLALGGYGIFGIITQVTMRVVDNCNLVLDSLSRLKVKADCSFEEKCEFERTWEACQQDKTVNVKMARLNVLTLETASVYVFRRDPYLGNTSSNLTLQPNELSPAGQLLYKWAMPLMKEYRYSAEESSGQAIDMPAHGYETTRNDVLWESALPLSKLYSPLFVVNDTFVLHEFFVPRASFQAWIRQVRPIYKDMDVYQKQGSGDVPAQSLTLLNTTIRFVNQDEVTCLSYSPKPDGMFAFVLYFRIKRENQVEQDLGQFHNKMAEVAVGLGGTFYLPYRKCYSPDLLRRAYPQIGKFAKQKEKYDPLGVFSNEWFEEYVLSLCSAPYQSNWQLESPPCSGSLCAANPVSKDEFLRWLPREEDSLLLQRHDSFRSLLQNQSAKKRFTEQFLVNIFNLADPCEVMRIISKAVWDPKNENDLAIFSLLREHFHGPSSRSGGISSLKQGWRAVRQLGHQKKELVRETASILYRLGLFGRVRGYLSVGDHGKTVEGFRAAGLFDPSRSTHVFVAHDFSPNTDELSVNVVLERGSLDPVGDAQIQFDFLRDDPSRAFSVVKSNSVELVTINQGLHHFPTSKLYDFLVEVRRVLCIGGVFIFREHDLQLHDSKLVSSSSAPVAMLDAAHSVFNAVTGVSVVDEATEIRAFRPLSEWREMMERIGFIDKMMYGMENGDPTFDFMMCFEKGGTNTAENIQWHQLKESSLKTRPLHNTWEPPIMGTIRALLAQVPAAVLQLATRIIDTLCCKLPLLEDCIASWWKDELPKALIAELKKQGEQSGTISMDDLRSALSVHSAATSFITNTIGKKVSDLVDLGAGAEHLIRGVQVREASDIAGLLSTRELWLVLPVLKRRAAHISNEVTDIEKRAVQFVESYLPLLFDMGQRTKACKEESNPGDASRPPTVTEEFVDAMQLANDDISEVTDGNEMVGYSEPLLHHRQEALVDSSVDPAEVLGVMVALGDRIEGLFNPAVVLPSSGLTLSQQSALLAHFAAPDLDGFAQLIATYHDRQSWKQLCWALTRGPQSVLESGDLPTTTRLFSKDLAHPWRSALKAFFKGPRVNLKRQALLAMRLLNLGDLISVYKEAKGEGDAESRCEDVTTTLLLDESNTLRAYTQAAIKEARVKEVSIRFDGMGCRDLYDVAEIVEARFGYKSITSGLTDITGALRSFHTKVQHDIASRTQRGPGAVKAGWLPIHESTLKNFRNGSGTASKLGDSMRKTVVGVGSLGMAGHNVLRLKYVPLQTSIGEKEATDLCSFVRSKGLVQEELHATDGHFTWFKLSEWMQVEILGALTNSLDHTAWYHFPFMEFLSVYFRVLFEECNLVAKEQGLVDAYGSVAFATDLIPGVFMSLIFAQLQLLAYPLKMTLPTSKPEDMVEEVLMTAALPFSESPHQYLSRQIDERVRGASLLCRPGDGVISLYKVTIPTFKPMSDILVKIGERIPSATLLQISNQKVVQVLLAIECDGPSSSNRAQEYAKRFALEIDEHDGLRVVVNYRFPMESEYLRSAGELHSRTIHLAVRAYVPSLLTLVRWAQLHDAVHIKQIYDFWSG